MENIKVIGITGMPGSGKGVVSGVARSMGFKVIRMGDVIRDEAKKRNADTGEIAIKLREEYGQFVVAERCVDKIKELNKFKKDLKGINSEDGDLYMIEGIRSHFEVEIFKDNFPGFKVIAVHSKPNTRFERLKKRMRPDDSLEESQLQKRDERELNFGIGNVIATSDYMVVNEGSIKKFKNVVRSILHNEMRN